MKVGVIGCGVVGGALISYLQNHSDVKIAKFDPPLGYEDDLSGCEHIFISVPVPPNGRGQNTTTLEACVELAKRYTKNVYVRSTVLPGTNDRLGTISMPEFLTERTAAADFEKLPILVGGAGRDMTGLSEVFPFKRILSLSNTEAELAKLTHNCFGAFKVSYFNIIEELSRKLGADYARVLTGAMITGFIEPTHTMVPGPDGLRGYGGKCFPENVDAMRRFLMNGKLGMVSALSFFEGMQGLNELQRADISTEGEIFREGYL